MTSLPGGATPLDAEELDELIPVGAATRGDVNALEQANILEAEAWLLRVSRPDILTPEFVLELHKRMFGGTWRWAGHYRRSQKNIGVEAGAIATALRELLADVAHQVTHRTWSLQEIAARFHHRLVQIHCFANGNGRHARLCADLLLERNGATRLDWGGGNLDVDGAVRRAYIAALRAADGHDDAPLLKFLKIGP